MNEQNRADCLARAEERFNDTWNANCKGPPKKDGDGCPLALQVATSLKQTREHERDECYRAFPVR